jgi:putative FmdB family regulatory protein
MPFYDFQCEQCEINFEVRATIKEKQAGLQPECPICHGYRVKQVVTAGLVLHGGDGGSVSSAGPACGCGSGGCCGS